jgi:hypothetical protein
MYHRWVTSLSQTGLAAFSSVKGALTLLPNPSCHHFKQKVVYPSISQDCGRIGPGLGVGLWRRGEQIPHFPSRSRGRRQSSPWGSSTWSTEMSRSSYCSCSRIFSSTFSLSSCSGISSTSSKSSCGKWPSVLGSGVPHAWTKVVVQGSLL